MRTILSVVVALSLLPYSVYCWGFFGHKKINGMAVYVLPTELMAFYKSNMYFITEHAVDADMRRYVVKEEAARHYIDIDHYGEHPFDSVPRFWLDAVEKYTEDTLQTYGIVPWHIDLMYKRLVESFRTIDKPGILKNSADLGHYIADAHVPLHTTENYNGQLTGQHGIHGLWESRLPELFSENYDYLIGRAEYIDAPLDAAWEAVEASHNAVDSVLELERLITNRLPTDRKYAYEERGNSTIKTYSVDFSKNYHDAMNNMVERRLRASIHCVASFWYSAWIEAGKPDLGKTSRALELPELEEEKKKLEAAYRKSPVQGRDHDD